MLRRASFALSFFFFNDTATTEIYTLSLHDALPISVAPWHYCVAYLVGDARLRDEVDRLVALRVIRRHPARRRPRIDHRHLALQPSRPLRHGVEIIVAGERRLVLRDHLVERRRPGRSRQLRLHRVVEELPAIGAVLLQKTELIARTAELTKMSRAVNIGRQLIGDELGYLRVIVPGRRHHERLAKFRLVRGLQLGIVENVLTVVKRELIAVVEHAPTFALVERNRLV